MKDVKEKIEKKKKTAERTQQEWPGKEGRKSSVAKEKGVNTGISEQSMTSMTTKVRKSQQDLRRILP